MCLVLPPSIVVSLLYVLVAWHQCHCECSTNCQENLQQLGVPMYQTYMAVLNSLAK